MISLFLLYIRSLIHQIPKQADCTGAPERQRTRAQEAGRLGGLVDPGALALEPLLPLLVLVRNHLHYLCFFLRGRPCAHCRACTLRLLHSITRQPSHIRHHSVTLLKGGVHMYAAIYNTLQMRARVETQTRKHMHLAVLTLTRITSSYYLALESSAAASFATVGMALRGTHRSTGGACFPPLPTAHQEFLVHAQLAEFCIPVQPDLRRRQLCIPAPQARHTPYVRATCAIVLDARFIRNCRATPGDPQAHQRQGTVGRKHVIETASGQ